MAVFVMAVIVMAAAEAGPRNKEAAADVGAVVAVAVRNRRR